MQPKGHAVSIRHAHIADRDALASLGARTFVDSFAAQNTPANMNAYVAQAFAPTQISQELNDPGSTFLIAEADDVAVGYAKLHVGEPPSCVTGPSPIELVRLYVERHLIGTGLGSELMRACLNVVQEQQCETIWLGVWEKNERALEFYMKWRFEIVGTQTFILGEDRQRDFVAARSLETRLNPHDANNKA